MTHGGAVSRTRRRGAAAAEERRNVAALLPASFPARLPPRPRPPRTRRQRRLGRRTEAGGAGKGARGGGASGSRSSCAAFHRRRSPLPRRSLPRRPLLAPFSPVPARRLRRRPPRRPTRLPPLRRRRGLGRQGRRPGRLHPVRRRRRHSPAGACGREGRERGRRERGGGRLPLYLPGGARLTGRSAAGGRSLGLPQPAARGWEVEGRSVRCRRERAGLLLSPPGPLAGPRCGYTTVDGSLARSSCAWGCVG